MAQHSVYCSCGHCDHTGDTRSPRTKARQAHHLNGTAPPKRGDPVPRGPLTQSIGDLVRALDITILDEPAQAPTATAKPHEVKPHEDSTKGTFSPAALYSSWATR